jgi:Phosphoinositide phospholipase C, Ca2+-dependent
MTMNAKGDGIRRPGFVHPAPFDRAAFDAWDGEIVKGLGRDNLITPDDVRGKFPALESAVRVQAWPKLSEARGKFFFGSMRPEPNSRLASKVMLHFGGG